MTSPVGARDGMAGQAMDGGAPRARRSEREVRIVLGMALFALLAGVPRILGHVSESPAVLGRWSERYAVFLLGYGLDLVGVVILAAAPEYLVRFARALCRLTPGAAAGCLGAAGMVSFVALPFVIGKPMMGVATWVGAGLGFAILFSSGSGRDLAATLNRLWTTRVVQGLVLCLAGLFVAFLAVEATLRIWRPAVWHRGPFINDPVVGLHVAGLTPVNRWGFRDYEYAPRKPAGAIRILGLGDSMTFGDGVPMEATFLKDLERRLAGRAGRAHEILNFAVPAHGPRDSLRVLRQVGLGTGPDLVLHHFYEGNDFWDNTPGSDRLALNGVPITVWRPEWFGGFPEWGWYTLQYMDILGKVSRVTAGVSKVAAAGGGADQPLDDRYWLMRLHGLEKYGRKKLDDPAQRAQLAFVRDLLLEMSRASRKAGAAFALVVIPDQVQVDPALRRRVLERYQLQEADFVFEFPSRFFARLAAEDGLTVLDLTPVFRRRAAPERAYLPLNIHLSESGHRLVAEALEAFLRPRLATLGGGRP